MNKIFYCVLPSFENYAGHEIEFIKYINRYALFNNFKLKYILPKNNKIKISNKVLIIEPIKKNIGITEILKNIKNVFVNFLTLKKSMGKIQKDDIIYIDCQSFYFQLSLILFFMTKIKTQLIMFWVRLKFNTISKRIIFNLFLKICKKKSFNKISILTENGNLNNYLFNEFRIKAQGIPSIHYIKIKKKKIKKKNFLLLCPGVYREEKYGENLKEFIKNNNHKSLKLLISEDFMEKLDFKTNFKIEYFQKNLNNLEYIKYYEKSDIIILPYDPIKYKDRFSGMMYEAISCGKFVFISDKTLMADHLRKVGLNDLVVKNWKKLDYSNIVKILNSNKIKKLIKINNINYLKNNNYKNFQKKFNEIINIKN